MHTSKENDSIENYIYFLKYLKKGWNFGSGKEIPSLNIEIAIKIYQIGKSRNLDAEVFPCDEGTITISFQNKDHFLDIKIINENSFDVKYEYGIGQKFDRVCIGLMNLYDLEKEILKFAKNK